LVTKDTETVIEEWTKKEMQNAIEALLTQAQSAMAKIAAAPLEVANTEPLPPGVLDRMEAWLLIELEETEANAMLQLEHSVANLHPDIEGRRADELLEAISHMSQSVVELLNSGKEAIDKILKHSTVTAVDNDLCAGLERAVRIRAMKLARVCSISFASSRQTKDFEMGIHSDGFSHFTVKAIWRVFQLPELKKIILAACKDAVEVNSVAMSFHRAEEEVVWEETSHVNAVTASEDMTASDMAVFLVEHDSDTGGPLVGGGDAITCLDLHPTANATLVDAEVVQLRKVQGFPTANETRLDAEVVPFSKVQAMPPLAGGGRDTPATADEDTCVASILGLSCGPC